MKSIRKFLKNTFKKFFCWLQLFSIGGLLYTILETLWRGYSHWTMFLVGGLCFIIIGNIHLLSKRRLLWRCVYCAAAITAIEFVSGCIINLYFHMGVWNYSQLAFNLLGQVCLIYSALWGLLSVVAIPVYRQCCRHVRIPLPDKLSAKSALPWPLLFGKKEKEVG